MKIERFEDIEGWQLGRELTKLVYKVTGTGRFARDYGLKDQIQRAAGSVMHNVAEGFDGGSNAEFVKFLRYAQRSCTEVQSQLYVAIDQGYVTEPQFNELRDMARLARSKIGAFIKYLLAYESRKRTTKNLEPRT
jgi:four helix bundle protein